VGTFGDIGTWVGSVGTVGTLAFTAYTLRRHIERERRNDDERRREQARLVRLSLDDDGRVASLVNDSAENVYRVRVLVKDKGSGEIYSQSAFRDIVAPGEHQSFVLERRDPAAHVPANLFCIAEFRDANGYRWNRYMMGLLTEVTERTSQRQP
jgi:hypothetical protein